MVGKLVEKQLGVYDRFVVLDLRVALKEVNFCAEAAVEDVVVELGKRESTY